MNNLTTRKIVLGMLMALVLAFGVQDVAEAINVPPNPTTDVVDYTNIREINSTTRISPAVSLNSSTSSEGVTITVSGGVEIITPVALATGADLVLTEGDHDGDGTAGSNLNGRFFNNATNLGISSFSVSVRFTAVGEQTVQIEDPTSYTPERTGSSWNKTYVFYVVEANTDRMEDVDLLNYAGTTVTGGYDTGRFGEYPHRIYGGNANLLVTYTVTGGGRVFVQDSSNAGSVPFEGSRGTSLTTSSAFDVYLDGNGTSRDGVLGSTNVVTATLRSSDASVRAVYIHGDPILEVNALTGTETGTEDNPGKPGEVLRNAFTATVKDGRNAAVPGVPVHFMTTGTGTLVFGSGNTGTLVQANNDLVTSNGNQVTADDVNLYVRTNSSGKASVNFRLGDGKSADSVTVSAVGEESKPFKVYAGSDAGVQLSELRIQSVSGSLNTFNLYALVEVDGDPPTSIPAIGENAPAKLLGKYNYDVRFTTDDGTLTGTPSNRAAATVWERPNINGIAQVAFVSDGGSNPEVTASLFEPIGGVQTITETVTFNITGSSNDPPPSTTTARLTIRVEGTGTTRAVTVTATNAQGVNIPGLRVALTGTALTTSRVVNTGTATVITLPTTPDDYTITATFSGYDPDTETVTVAASAALGTFSITTIDAPVNGQQTIEVTVLNANGARASVPVTVTLVGPGISRTVETTRGTGRAIITIPTTTTSYTLTVRADGYTRKQETFTTTGQRAEAPAPPSGPAGEADSVEIDGSRTRSGTVNEELAAPLRVRVVDANDNGVEDVRVVFRVLSPGRGTFPGARGSGRATQDQTDRNGYVSVDFTPISTGNVTVRATPAGGIAPVTFIIDVGEAADDDDPEPPTPSRDEAPSREISPVVHLGMASRPPMLWVDGGAIYALVGADVQKFAPGVDNALNITVGGGKVYWTEKTGDAGTINSANVDGSDVKELASIFATPMGIAVDVAGSKLYWTNSRGRIQSANLDGSGITNELQDLPSPMDIALAGGNGYWTQGNGSVRLVNLTGQKIVRDISTGTDTPGSLVIGGGKVYWTEMTGDSSGTVNSANLNGTDVKELKSIQAVPMGIAVDGSRSKLYWTNSRGRIQSANLDGSGITNVVSGLGSPGDMVLSNSITAPAAAPAETASGSKYDVNGDGTVDNADSDAVTVAIAAGATDAKYDVNGDGTVNVFDLVEIIANRDPGAAGAPTLFGMKMSAAQIDSLQEQIDLLIATNDRSPAAMRTLIYLQQLLVTARPEKTLLLANYPNPFNPETWIPYELATDTNVKVTIYNTQGVVIRSLQLGHQSAGYYMGRDRAAYWDGRNALGEQVASGLYFYQLETDAMSLMRKMVILK